MKTVILAGGLGTRLAEETIVKPKPMVEIGGRPVLWHIMQIYSAAGFNEFIVALGYKGEMIKEYFLNFHTLSNDCTVDLAKGTTEIHSVKTPPWKVHLVDTGDETMTGGRLKRLRAWIGNETFLMTYGDGVAAIDVRKLVDFHRSHGKLATMTSVRPPYRFGGVVFDGSRIREFSEKPQFGEGWINGGFFVLEPGVLDYIEGDATTWERDPLERMAAEGQLMAYKHEGFWQCMDTQREKQMLERLWDGGKAPWKIW
jgi:glucose-1-phosphate cytidylyltransferase